MSILQEPPRPALPVTCDFFFEQTGPPGIATYDGDTYPYPPLPSDKGSDYRYAWGTTPVFLPVEFFGIAHIVEGKVQPHVIAPPEISILEYFWDFGDGHTGYGPIVTHTYTIPDPTTAISLTVLDSLGREFSTSKALGLVIVDFGYVYQRIRGHNTENPPKRQEVEASGDFALTVEGSPTFIIEAHGGKKVREQSEQAVSNDRPFILTHFYRSTSDQSLSSDSPKRQRGIFRSTTDTSITTDVAKRQMQRFAQAFDEAWTLEGGAQGVFFRPLFAKLISIASVSNNSRHTLTAILPSQGAFGVRTISHALNAKLSFSKISPILAVKLLTGSLSSLGQISRKSTKALKAKLTSIGGFPLPRTYEGLEKLGEPTYTTLEGKFATYEAMEGPQIKE